MLAFDFALSTVAAPFRYWAVFPKINDFSWIKHNWLISSLLMRTCHKLKRKQPWKRRWKASLEVWGTAISASKLLTEFIALLVHVFFTELCSLKWIEETQTHAHAHALWYANCDASVPCSRRIFFLMQGTTHWIRYIQGKIVRTRICTKHQRVKSISFYFGKGFQCQIINLHRFVFDLRQVNHRSARQGRNPKTGDTISIAASNVPAFVPGKALRESVN